MKRFLIPILVVLAVGAIVAVIEWNKPHPKAEDATGIAVSSEALYAAFRTNEQAANKQYLNKVLVVSGQLESKEVNQDGQTVVVLRGDMGDDLLAGGIMCTLRDKGRVVPAQAIIKLKGFCTGLANDVHLTDCIISNP